MLELDITKAYDLRDLNYEQKEELLEWLRKEEPNESWDQFLDTSIFLYYNTEWFESFTSKDIDKEIVNASSLFKKYKEMIITEEQKQQLLNLNDSRVNEILGMPKEGKWYFNGNGNTLFHYGEKRYGFDRFGEWSSRIGTGCDNTLIEATNEQVENALIEEAKRRGLTYENKLKDCNDILFNEGYGSYVFGNNKLYYNGATLFDDGKWAEVIVKPNKEEIINQINELLKEL